MSTRAAILRAGVDSEMPTGVYHHFDGYPTGLGKTLFHVIRGHFKGDIQAALTYLIDDHPAGWSTINEADFTQPPGFEENGFRTTGPHCYCHGGRSEEASPLTLEMLPQSWCEYAYVINPEARSMTVLDILYEREPKFIARVDLDGDEPDWSAIEENGEES